MKPRDDKYNVPGKPKKPATKQEQLDAEIRELIRQRDETSSAVEKQRLNAQITKLFAEYQRSQI